MTEERERDPAVFLTTLPRWDQAAFLSHICSQEGALAAIQVDLADERARRGEARNEALGTWILRRWPAVVHALTLWPNAAAQRGGWALIWAYAPAASRRALGDAMAAALGPSAEIETVGRLVVVPVAIGAGEAALRAAEDELHRWSHGAPAVELRWVDQQAR